MQGSAPRRLLVRQRRVRGRWLHECAVVAVVVVTAGGTSSTHKIVRVVPSGGAASSSSSSGSARSGGPSASTGAGTPGNQANAQLTAFSGNGYSISYPSGWKNVHSEKSISDFVESSWSPPGDRTVVLLIDHNASSGSAETDAARVRDPVSQTSGYQELGWDSQQLPPGSGQVWKFDSKGVEELDTFFSACGTSFAVLGKAPIDEFSQYESVFVAARDSFRPTC